MTRYLISDDPGAAHPAKNVAAPGLPNQSHNHSERVPMVSQHLVDDAAKRTGYRAELVAVPVAIIARRHNDGQAPRQITRYLHDHLGSDNQAATPAFVGWVIGRIERGEGA
jgi:hypothetical protein